MPVAIKQFRAFLIASILVGVVAFVLLADVLARFANVLMTSGDVASLMVNAGVQFGLGYAVWAKRANWARWVLIVLFVIGIPFTLYGYRAIFSLAPGVALVQVAAIGLGAYAIGRLFTPDAVAWCRKPSATPTG